MNDPARLVGLLMLGWAVANLALLVGVLTVWLT